MTFNFEKYAVEGNEFLSDLLQETGLQNRDKLERMLIAFFRTLRHHLTLQENFQLIAQLPMALKSLYIDQWDIDASYKRVRTLKGFMIEMMEADAASGWHDFHNQNEAIKIARKIFRVMSEYLSVGELNDVGSILPPHLQEFFKEEIKKGRELRWKIMEKQIVSEEVG
jgi:uncharacterized protein (DUF2267 family)